MVAAAVLFPGSGDEAGRVLHLDGGTWVSTEQRIREGQQHRDLTARTEYLEAHASDAPTAWIAAALGAGLVVGGLTAALLVSGVVKH